MSDIVSNLGNFKPLTFSQDEPKRRMAGDYLREFTNTAGSGNTMNNSSVGNSSGSNKKSAYDSWMSHMKNLGSDSSSSNNSNTPPGKSSTNNNASNPDYINTKDPNQVAGNALGGINYDAMADARMATATKGEINGGVNKDYWIKQYQKNNSEYEQNKALMASYQGPKTWDEFSALDQSRTGTVKEQNTGTINDYNAFHKYQTAKQGVSHWEEATAKYRN